MMHIPYLCSVLASRHQDSELTCFVRRQEMTESNTDKVVSLLLIRWKFLAYAGEDNHLNHLPNKESLAALNVCN